VDLADGTVGERDTADRVLAEPNPASRRDLAGTKRWSSGIAERIAGLAPEVGMSLLGVV